MDKFQKIIIMYKEISCLQENINQLQKKIELMYDMIKHADPVKDQGELIRDIELANAEIVKASGKIDKIYKKINELMEDEWK